jgi:hypothetical protein
LCTLSVEKHIGQSDYKFFFVFVLRQSGGKKWSFPLSLSLFVKVNYVLRKRQSTTKKTEHFFISLAFSLNFSDENFLPLGTVGNKESGPGQ